MWNSFQITNIVLLSVITALIAWVVVLKPMFSRPVYYGGQMYGEGEGAAAYEGAAVPTLQRRRGQTGDYSGESSIKAEADQNEMGRLMLAAYGADGRGM